MDIYSLAVRVTFIEELLGSAPNEEEIYRAYVGAKAPDDKHEDEEAEAVRDEEGRSVSVFPKVNGSPIVWDYQVKGFFKDTCSVLKRVPKTKSGGIRAFKKEIDGLVHVYPRAIPL